MSVDLLQHFPYESPREIQARALETLGQHWNDYDVFVLGAPTAFGKTAVAKTLMNAFHNVSVITPTNMLVEQFKGEFSETCSLSRLDAYRCDEWQRPCSVTRGKLRQFCKGCPAAKDLATAKYRRGPGVYNYHIYLAQKLYRDVLVVDEAHNLIPFIRERFALKLWQHDYKYPGNMFTPQQMAAWVDTLPPAKRKHKKIEALEDAVKSTRPAMMPARAKEEYNGKGTIRGEPEERDCLKLLPVDIRGVPPLFWPKEVKKIVLLSATINQKDIETLGLSGKRVLMVNCESPIPAGHRPIVARSVTAVNRFNMREATDRIGNYINDIIAPFHQKEKGIIHATYQQAELLRNTLKNERYMFHNRFDKTEVYQAFRQAPVDSGRVLVASGMYEGIDLPGDLGRWQVIAKIPWPSLGNPAIKYLAEQDPDHYSWEVWKVVMQACGRICRTPEDYGATYILDDSFQRLLKEAGHMTPAWFKDALVIDDDKLAG